ncbi:copper resistance CopC family protein [Micromonosporaceae bacterium Da 78-11]
MLRRTVAGTFVALALTVASPARADTPGVSGNPVDGAALAQPPARVTVDFGRPVDPELTHVGVTGGSGTEVSAGEPYVQAGLVEVPVTVTGRGDVTVAYHVTFTDGAGQVGAYRFSVGTGVVPAALSVGAGRRAAADLPHSHGIDPVGATLLVVDAVVLAGALLLLRLRPRDGSRAPMRLGPELSARPQSQG